MKRDDDYLRDYLLAKENKPDWLFIDPHHHAMSEKEQKEHYHIQLLNDVGFVTYVAKGTFRITAQGHDFLDAIRDEGIWAKTKAGAASVGGVSLGILKEVAVAYVRQELATKLGIAF